MKEATGELNMTLVIVVAISILVAFFYFVIWPDLDANFKANSTCSKAICENPCGAGNNSCEDAVGKLVNCYYVDNRGNRHDNISCPWKG